MTKELTPLEALKELKYQVGNIRAGTHDSPPQISTFLVRDMGLFEIIETALKQHEVMLEALPLNCKNNRALEIIKKLFKGHLNIDYDKNHDFYEIWTSNEYEDMFVIASGRGKEEYDLLREVLL